jgi:hypothetical protein
VPANSSPPGGFEFQDKAPATSPLTQVSPRESGQDEELWVKVEFFEGSEIEFLLARQQADGDPLKEPHVPSVIAATFIQILKIDPEYPISNVLDAEGRIVRKGLISTCPKDYNPRIVEALTRWKSLPKAVQEAFDHGIDIEGVVRPVPIGLLPGMDKFASEDKLGALKELIAGGYKTFSGVTKFVNQKAFTEAIEAEAAEEAAAETDVPEAKDDDKPAKARGSSNGKAHDTSGSFMVRKSACKKAYEHVIASKAPADVIAFAAGAAFDHGLEVDTEGWPQKLVAFVNGIAWRRGIPGVKAPAEVKEALVADKKEPKQGKEKGTSKKPGKGKGKGKKGASAEA